MLTVKCPSCAAGLKLRQAPASGRVKCPKCGKPVSVTAPVASPQPVAAGGMLDPDDEGFDFGQINAPSSSGVNAVSHFPVAGPKSVNEGPRPGDPLEAVQQEEMEGLDVQDAPGAPAAKPRNPMVLLGALGGVGVLLIVGIVVAATQFGGGGGGGAPDVDVLAAAQATAPTGYEAVGIEGCVVLMPKGFKYKELPSVIESVAIESSESGSVYFMGAMNGGRREIDKDQMRKKASRQLGGDILGGNPTERNGYQGIKGMLDGSIFLPRMKVEVFHVDERFVIIGVAPASMGADPSAELNRGAERAEEEIFYKSFKVGPKPSGGWFGN